jgi:hypothetical protein
VEFKISEEGGVRSEERRTNPAGRLLPPPSSLLPLP